MSQKDRREWEAILSADPALRAAWNGFTRQLAHDAAFIKQGWPTGQAIGEAAQRVYEAFDALPDSAVELSKDD